MRAERTHFVVVVGVIISSTAKGVGTMVSAKFAIPIRILDHFPPKRKWFGTNGKLTVWVFSSVAVILIVLCKLGNLSI